MSRGFMYLVAVMDWYSRKVLSWRVSNSLDSNFCVEALTEALSRYGRPEIFNTDQGAQFTSQAFMDSLKQHNVAITWTAAAESKIIFSLSGFGGRSSISIFTCGLLVMAPSFAKGSVDGLSTITENVPIKPLTI